MQHSNNEETMNITYQDLNILFEDNHILVVMKPANVPCQADESKDPDMLTLLKQYLIEKYNKPGDAYLGLVHRLDRPTGGVMVFAKTSKAASRLSEQIRAGEVDKKYMCIVEGEPKERSGKLINYLKKYASQNIIKVVPMAEEGAKYAELDYKVLETKKGCSLLQIKLVTGRAHQIRVQMATAGYPLVGDYRYGNAGKYKTQVPLCLWSTEIRFNHPISGNSMVFRVYPPEEEPWTQFNVNAFLSINMKNYD